VEGAAEAPAVRRRLWQLAGALVPRRRPGDFNQALMELGATVCARSGPRCQRCPLAPCCLARRAGREREVPPARRRRAPARLHLACALLERGGAVLVARRPPGGLFGGLWELPSAEVRPGDRPERALASAVSRRLGADVAVGALAAEVDRVLTHRLLRLSAYRCSATPWPGARAGLAWAPADALGELALPTAMRLLAAAAMAPPAVSVAGGRRAR